MRLTPATRRHLFASEGHAVRGELDAEPAGLDRLASAHAGIPGWVACRRSCRTTCVPGAGALEPGFVFFLLRDALFC